MPYRLSSDFQPAKAGITSLLKRNNLGCNRQYFDFCLQLISVKVGHGTWHKRYCCQRDSAGRRRNMWLVFQDFGRDCTLPVRYLMQV